MLPYNGKLFYQSCFIKSDIENNNDDPNKHEELVPMVIKKCWNRLQRTEVMSENLSLNTFPKYGQCFSDSQISLGSGYFKITLKRR